MNCDQAQVFVAAYADGELDGLKRRSVEKHLRGCARCAAAHADILSLRIRLRSELPYFAAPPGLRERVHAIVAGTAAEATPIRARPARGLSRWLGRGALADGTATLQEQWRWLGSGALAGCAATALAFVVATSVVEWRSERDIAREAVAGHVRAVLDHQLIEIASSDQHTVKPWLSARLDYSPPVQDLAKDGFPLLGGRLATLEGRPVATLVYRYRNHVIDVFVRPSSANASALRTLRGFNIAHARSAEWDWLAVSDVSADVLSAFVGNLAHVAPPGELGLPSR